MSKVIIESIASPNIWHFTETPDLCIYANEHFIADDGTLVLAGDPRSNEPHLKVPCQLPGAQVLLIPSFEIDSTPLDVPARHTARYTAILKTRTYEATFLGGFAVPPEPSDMTWNFLRTYQYLGRRFSHGPQAEHQAMVTSMIADALTFLRYGSETRAGMVALSNDPTDPIFPIAVSVTDPLWEALTVGSGLIVASGREPLVNGVATVDTGAVAADSKVLVSSVDDGVSGALRVTNIVPGVSFDIVSSNGGDNGLVTWVILS